MSVTYPVPWAVGEDQRVEYSGAPYGTSDQYRLLFWIDILAVDTHGQKLLDAPSTATGFLTWLSRRANLAVTSAHASTVGAGHLPAHVVDISIPSNAKTEDPSCTTACVGFLSWLNSGNFFYGIQQPNVVRLYLADVRVDGVKRVFAIAIEAKDAVALRAFAPVAQQVINSATGPLTKG